MSTDTVTTAVVKRDNSPTAMIERYSDSFATVLPSHIKPATWVRLAVSLFRRDEKLAAAAQSDPNSMFAALMDAARQGLEPGTDQYYLTPRKVKGKPTVLGIRGYQGEVELIYRAGAVSSVIVEVVREEDTFTYVPGRHERPVHEIDWFGDRGELRGVYAYAVMKDGATSKVVVLNRRHIEAAKKYSYGSNEPTSPWQTSEEAMWLKTAAHRLQKWVPTSAEYMREQLRAVRDVQAEQPQPPQPAQPQSAPQQTDPTDVSHLPEADPEVMDAELVEPEFDDEYATEDAR